MTVNASNFRQQVDQYRERLNKLARGELDHQDRPMVKTTGRSRPVVHEPDNLARLAIYGRRRHNSVARVMALFALLRDHENLAGPGVGTPVGDVMRARRPVDVENKGAKWQAFTGTHEMPACHTCPALLELNTLLPTYMTDNMGLRRHIIAAFGDCMMMPRWVNDADGTVDSSAGRQAFADAGTLVINDANASWRDGLEHFVESMRGILGGAFDVLVNPGRSHIKLKDEEAQQRLDAVCAFYEGLFLTPAPDSEIRNLIVEARQEMAIP